MKIDVFHNAFGDEDMDFVATVSVADEGSVEKALEVAWRKTNHVDEAWYGNEGVACRNYKARSSCVNDYFRVVETDEFYRVAGCGFEKVDDDTIVPSVRYLYNDFGQVVKRIEGNVPFIALKLMT